MAAVLKKYSKNDFIEKNYFLSRIQPDKIILVQIGGIELNQKATDQFL